MREIVLINITGEDRPGLTAAITGVLAQGGVNILDIGQAVIHDTLSFGILIEIPDNGRSQSVLKDLLFTAYELDQQVRFTPVSEDDYRQWVGGQGKARHIVTLLTRKVSAEQLRLEAELGFLAAMFQEKIEAKLHAQFDAMLAS